MREELAPQQGEEATDATRSSGWGTSCWSASRARCPRPRLGLELRRRSPFRHTCIIGLANENIGYIPDRKAYADGGYQTWMGRHSKLEVGTGEAMVDQAVAMLDALYDSAPPLRRGLS